MANHKTTPPWPTIKEVTDFMGRHHGKNTLRAGKHLYGNRQYGNHGCQETPNLASSSGQLSLFYSTIRIGVLDPHISTRLYKGFPWFTGWYWLIRFDFTTVSCGDSGQSGLTLQLFPVETIVTSNLIGQNKRIVHWNCFIQLGAGKPKLKEEQTVYGLNIFYFKYAQKRGWATSSCNISYSPPPRS